MAAVLVLAAAIAGCAIRPSHPENAALRMGHPGDSPPQLLAYAPPGEDYPSTGGDILKGSSPGEQAAERAAVATPSGPSRP